MQIRRAVIQTTDQAAVARFLPDNYRVVGLVPGGTLVPEGTLIAGQDEAGWTLDGYVLPRLASGLLFGSEVSEGITPAQGPPPIPEITLATTGARMQQLRALRDQGLLTEDELGLLADHYLEEA